MHTRFIKIYEKLFQCKRTQSWMLAFVPKIVGSSGCCRLLWRLGSVWGFQGPWGLKLCLFRYKESNSLYFRPSVPFSVLRSLVQMRLYLDYSAVNPPILALSVSYNCTYLEIVILEKEDLSSIKRSDSGWLLWELVP